MVTSLLLSVMLPGVVAVIGVVIGHVLGRMCSGEGRASFIGELLRHGFGAIGLGVGFALAFRFTEGIWPALPPVQRWHWLVFMALAAAGIGILHGAWARSHVAPLLTALLLALAAAAMLQPLPSQDGHMAWKLMLGAAVGGLFLLLSPLAARRPGHVLPLVLVVTCTAVSVVLVEARSAKFGQIAGSLAAMSGMLMVAALLMRRVRLDGGPIAVFAMMIPAWMVTGIFYDGGELPRIAFAMVPCAPLLVWIGEYTPIARRGGVLAWAVRVVPAALVCGAAVAIALLGSAPPPEPYEW